MMQNDENKMPSPGRDGFDRKPIHNTENFSQNTKTKISMRNIPNFCDFKVVSDAFPQTLKQLRRWILWRLEIRDGAQTKVPYRTDGLRASITNPNDWTDFDTACRAFDPAKYSGLGFVLTKEDNIVCIDLDECITDGKISDKAMYIVKILNSWTEISQSGKGLHIFVRGTKPTDQCKVTLNTSEIKAIEVYDNARYIALTGNHLPGTPLEIIERQWALNDLYARYFPKQESTPPQAIKPHHDLERGDEEIIALCRKAKNADKFVALYDNGDTSLYNGDESRADEALACMLAFYTQDEAQLERLMNKSALGQREKWRRREDYRQRTIRKALSLTREHYDAKPKSTTNHDSHSLTSPKVKLDVKCPNCDSFTLYYIMQDGMYFLKCESCSFNKLEIEFRDNLDEGKLEVKCPKCGLWQDEKLFLKCESCGFTPDNFLLRHESTLRHELAVIDNPMPNPLEKKYPLEKLNRTSQPQTETDSLPMKPCDAWLDDAEALPPITPLFDAFWSKGELAFLFGTTGIGKSILAVQIADAISKGSKIACFDGPQEPMRVGLFDFEHSTSQFAKRYRDENGNRYKFSPNFLRAEFKARARIPKGISRQDYILELIEKKIIEHRLEVVVIDNLTALDCNVTEPEVARELMYKLDEIKSRYNISMLVIGHTPKRDLNKPLTENDMLGSKNLINFCDSAFAIGKSVKESHLRYLIQVKCRNAEYKYGSENVAIFRVVKNGPNLFFEHNGFQNVIEQLRTRTDAEANELNEKIIALHQSDPNLSYAEIAKQLGTNKMRVSRVLNKAMDKQNSGFFNTPNPF